VKTDIIFCAWVLLVAAELTGAAMVVIGMFEELPGIIRSTFGGSDRSR
jgi:hypothetical protein